MLDSTLTTGIDVTINPKTMAGERETIASMDRMIRHGQRLSASNDNLAGSNGRLGRSIGGVAAEGGRLGSSLSGVDASSGRLNGRVGGLTQSFNALRGAMITTVAVGVGAAFMDIADKAGLMDAKLRLATQGWGDFYTAQADVQRISRQTNSEITSTSVLYGKLAKAGATMNASQRQVARATETVTKAFKVGGASSAEMETGVLQLGQALGSGKLSGDEFTALMETSPRLMELFAASVGKPVGALKKLASDGKLTSDVLFKALTDPKFTAKLDAEARQLPRTFGDAFTAVTNLATTTFGAFNEGGGFSKSLYDFATQGGDNMNSIADAARQTGSDIGLAFSSLSTAFDPMLNGAMWVLEQISGRATGLGIEFREILGLIDQVNNLGIGITRAGEGARQRWENAKSAVTGQPAAQVRYTPWANSAGQYDRDKPYRDARVREAQVARDTARYALRTDAKGRLVGIGAKAGGTGVLRSATVEKDDKGGKKSGEVGRTLSGADLDRRLASIGARVTSRERTADQQRGLIARWEREDPRTRGIRPADPSKSAHVAGNGGLARDIAKGRGVSLASITAAVGKGNIKQLLDEGDHFHLSVKGKGGGQASEAATEAEKLAERIGDFWKGVSGQSGDARETLEALSRAASEGKSLSAASADTAKQLEFQRLAGREITAQERERIATALQSQRTSEFLTTSLVAAEQRKRDMAVESELLGKRIAGASEAQLEIERGVLKWRQQAIEAGATENDLRSAAFLAAENLLRVDLARGRATQDINKGLDEQRAKLAELAKSGSSYAKEAVGQYGTTEQRRAAARGEYQERVRELEAARSSKDPEIKISSAEFEAGTKRAGEELQDRFREIGDDFSNRMRDAADLFNRIGSMLGGKLGRLFSTAGDVADRAGSFKDDSKGIADGFKKVFGEKSPAVANIGKAVGDAVAGAGIGEQVGQLSKAMGIKTSKLGSQVGGAIGGAIGGPLGAAVGGFIGGTVGGLFKKTKSGGATISGAGEATLSGRTGAYKKEAGGLAGQVQTSLQDIARQLGGSLGSFSGITIGKRGDDYRVNTSGTSLKTKKGASDFGDDAGAAVEFAIKQAISRGALAGLSDFAQKAVGGLEIADAITLVQDWKTAMRDFESMRDPVTAAVTSVTDSLDALRKGMVGVGASTTDLTRLDEYRAAKLKAVLKDQVSGFQDLLNDLNGDAGGFSDYAQLQSKLGQFETYKADIAAGRQVDQSAFVTLANDIRGKAGILGTQTQEAQNIFAMLRDGTTGAITNATTAFNAASSSNQVVVDAVREQQNAQAANTQQTNNILTEQTELLRAIRDGFAGGGFGGQIMQVMNARLNAY